MATQNVVEMRQLRRMHVDYTFYIQPLVIHTKGEAKHHISSKKASVGRLLADCIVVVRSVYL